MWSTSLGLKTRLTKRQLWNWPTAGTQTHAHRWRISIFLISAHIVWTEMILNTVIFSFLRKAWPAMIGRLRAGLVQLLWSFILFLYYHEPTLIKTKLKSIQLRVISFEDTWCFEFSAWLKDFLASHQRTATFLFSQQHQAFTESLNTVQDHSVIILEMIKMKVTEISNI